MLMTGSVHGEYDTLRRSTTPALPHDTYPEERALDFFGLGVSECNLVETPPRD